MARLLILQLFLFISCIYPSFAQEKQNPVRLLVQKTGFNTYTATTVARGSLQAETELTYFRNNRRYIYNISASLPQVKVRYGITDRMEVNIGTAFNYSTTRFRSTGESCLFCRTWYGNDYITAGFRANILRYNDGDGLITLSGEFYIPGTKAEKVMSMGNFPRLQLITSGRLGDKFGYIFNLGTGTEEGNPYFGLFSLGGTTTWYLSEKATFFMGLSHQFKATPKEFGPIANSVTVADGGFLYSLLPNLQLQTATGISLFDLDQNPDFSAKMGLAWGINLRKQ